MAAFVVALCMVSCSDSPDSLSASKAESLVKKELKRQNGLEGAAHITVGYFECNDDATRYIYRQLAANGLVNYSCEKIMKPERVWKTRQVLRNSYWGSYTTTEGYWANEEVPTYFVTVTLTDKGQKLVYEAKDIEPTDDEKELRLDYEIDLSKYPEAAVDYVEFPETVEEVKETVAVEEEVEEPYYEEVTDYAETEEADNSNARTPQKTAYEIAKEKENYENVMLKAYELDIVKARNVMKTGDFSATAEVVFEYDDVTPVGRILLNVYEGQRFLMSNVSYKFYQDKGWIVTGSGTVAAVEEAIYD